MIQTGGIKRKTQEAKRQKFHEDFCEIGTLLSISLSKFCQILHRYKFDKKIAKSCQTFVNLLFLALCCLKSLPNVCQKSKRNCK